RALDEAFARVVRRRRQARPSRLDGAGVLALELQRDRKVGAREIARCPPVQDRVDRDPDLRRRGGRRRPALRGLLWRLLRLRGGWSTSEERQRQRDETDGSPRTSTGHGSETPLRFSGTVRRDFVV